MTRSQKHTLISWMVGLVTFVVPMTGIVFFSIAVASNNTYDTLHQAGWKKHPAVILSHGNPNYQDNPPSIPSRVSFQDFYGRQVTQSIGLTYNTEALNKFTIDVSKDGTYYSTAINDNGSQDDPYYVDNSDSLVVLVIMCAVFLFAAFGAGITVHERLQARRNADITHADYGIPHRIQNRW